MRFRSLLTAIFACAAASTAFAQDAQPALQLELNAVQPSEKGCRLTFVVKNNLGAELSRAAFEVALFNELGVVDRLTVLDFKELPAGKTKVTRFELANTDCTKITRVLINGATECQGEGIEPTACMRQLTTSSKGGVEFGV